MLSPMNTYLSNLSQPKGVKYGTAGFRDHHSKLDYIMYAVGRLAALRSSHQKKAIGVMMTASHNPAEDNGVKIVDPSGHMLVTEWEAYATRMVNEDMATTIEHITSTEAISDTQPIVILGMDTRDSGPRLMKHLKTALMHANARIIDLNQVTTPQLHWATQYFNQTQSIDKVESLYYQSICDPFSSLTKEDKPLQVVVDGANGIGAPKLALLLHQMQHYIPNYHIHQFNGDGVLNEKCGADHVKTNQCLPNNALDTPIQQGHLGASFDGDADRIVFYFQDTQFHLLDGDRISALCALGIQKLLQECQVNANLGVVQTAYANGSSTAFLKSLNIPVVMTPTGVKHLHHAAEAFDIGIYFEANGHGTVLFKPEFVATATHPKIQALYRMVNQTTGDALSDLFLVLFMLQYLKMSPSDWLNLYTDKPNKLFKVVVKDRYAFETTNAEQTLVKPEGIQEKIDQLSGRSFVRPSGTENVVRVYAEHETMEACEELGATVCGLVFDMCGVGEKPKGFK